jgi:hypothetical protein
VNIQIQFGRIDIVILPHEWDKALAAFQLWQELYEDTKAKEDFQDLIEILGDELQDGLQ